MQDVMAPPQDLGWVLHHEGYNVLSESAVEFSLCAGQWFFRPARRARRQPGTDLG